MGLPPKKALGLPEILANGVSRASVMPTRLLGSHRPFCSANVPLQAGWLAECQHGQHEHSPPAAQPRQTNINVCRRCLDGIPSLDVQVAHPSGLHLAHSSARTLLDHPAQWASRGLQSFRVWTFDHRPCCVCRPRFSGCFIPPMSLGKLVNPDFCLSIHPPYVAPSVFPRLFTNGGSGLTRAECEV